MRRNGITGHGEATTPPYLKEQQVNVIAMLSRMGIKDLDELVANGFPVDGPAARAAMTTAYFDLISKEKDIDIDELLEVRIDSGSIVRHDVITLGLGPLEDIDPELQQLPAFNSLKIKLDGNDDLSRLERILTQDGRPVLLDANQAWCSLDHALEVLELVGTRCIGLEQPFPVERTDLQTELIGRTDIPVYADESITTLADLERLAGIFSGVNIKLMKCGGLDRAVEIARKARSFGHRVMLGSMSESSLGCGAMMALAGIADVVDLDGPWLLANDPFHGMVLERGQLVMKNSISEIPETLLNWTPIGA